MGIFQALRAVPEVHFYKLEALACVAAEVGLTLVTVEKGAFAGVEDLDYFAEAVDASAGGGAGAAEAEALAVEKCASVGKRMTAVEALAEVASAEEGLAAEVAFAEGGFDEEALAVAAAFDDAASVDVVAFADEVESADVVGVADGLAFAVAAISVVGVATFVVVAAAFVAGVGTFAVEVAAFAVGAGPFVAAVAAVACEADVVGKERVSFAAVVGHERDLQAQSAALDP
jgi:hypothetical protein